MTRARGMLVALAMLITSLTGAYIVDNTAVVTVTASPVLAVPTPSARQPKEPCLSNSKPFYFANIPAEVKEGPRSFGPPVTVHNVDNPDRKSPMYTTPFKAITAKPKGVGSELIARLCGRVGFNGRYIGNLHGGDQMLYKSIMALDEQDPDVPITHKQWEDGVEYLINGGGIQRTMRTERVVEEPRGYTLYMEPNADRTKPPRLGVTKFTHWQSWVTYVTFKFKSGREVHAELRDDCGFQLRFHTLDKVPLVLRDKM